jgi:hypothetical protein
MVTAPSHPPVHSYDPGKDPMEIVDTASGRMERWRADALLVGETSGLSALSKQILNDSVAITARQDAREAELNARQDSLDVREKAHAVSVANFVDFVGKASVLFDKLERRRADAIAGKQDEPLAHPPGDPPDPSLSLEDDTHIPGGELHVIPAKDPEQEHAQMDRAGDRLRLKYPVRSEDQNASSHGGLPHPQEKTSAD